MSFDVRQMAALLDQIAPPELSEDWDCVGLQVGSLNWEVRKIWVSLDPSLDIVTQACINNVSLLVTHHPIFLKKLTRIDADTTMGKIVGLALKNKLAIFCLHTNFDSVNNGVNDILAAKIGLLNTRVMRKQESLNNNGIYKLAVFVPKNHQESVAKVLFATDAGRIGTYSCCSFQSEGVGTFLPSSRSKPYLGCYGRLSEEKEVKIETVVTRKNLENILCSLRKIHPYETMAYDVYPLITNAKSGLGRIGELKTATSLYELVKIIKCQLGINTLKVSGNMETNIKTVAVCSGSGSGMIQDFFKSKAQTYVSGEISYHAAKDAQSMGLTTIELGHFNSEQLAIKSLSERLKKNLAETNNHISISAVDIESDVFNFV